MVRQQSKPLKNRQAEPRTVAPSIARLANIKQTAVSISQDGFTSGSASATTTATVKFTGFAGPSAPGAGANVYWNETNQHFVVENAGWYEWYSHIVVQRGGGPSAVNLGPQYSQMNFAGTGFQHNQFSCSFPEFNYPGGPGVANITHNFVLSGIQQFIAGAIPFMQIALQAQPYNSGTDPLIHTMAITFTKIS